MRKKMIFWGLILCTPLLLTGCFKEITNLDAASNPEVVADLEAGQLAHYTFDNRNGYDVSGNDHHGNINGDDTPNFGTGIIGNAVYLNGSKNIYFQIPYNFFNSRSRWTVSFWAKGMMAGRIFSAQYPSYNSDYYDVPALLALQAGSLFMVTQYNVYGTNIAYNYINNSGSWHHFVIVLDGVNNNDNAIIKFYVDGTLIDNISPYYDKSSVNNCTKIVFGGNKNGAYGLAASLWLDEVRFFSRALSNKEVLMLYNLEQP